MALLPLIAGLELSTATKPFWGTIAGTLSSQEDLVAALAAKQALDADLTAIAALTTLAFGRSVLEMANAAALNSTLGTVTLAADTQTLAGTKYLSIPDNSELDLRNAVEPSLIMSAVVASGESRWGLFGSAAPLQDNTDATTAMLAYGMLTNPEPTHVANGGTGLGSYAVGDLLYASGATTLAKLADVATTNVLISGGIGAAPSWGKVDVAGGFVTGALPVVNGGTGLTSYGDVAFAAGKSSDQVISDYTQHLVTFDTETVDTDGAFASSQFTVPAGKAGWYDIQFSAGIDTAALIHPSAGLWLRVNGTRIAGAHASFNHCFCRVVVYLTAGQVVDVDEEIPGATLAGFTIIGSTLFTRFEGRRISL